MPSPDRDISPLHAAAIQVVCALIHRQGRVLLAQRPSGKHLALKWEFPGGKVERDEDPQQAIVREIQEELGCAISVRAALPVSRHAYDRGVIDLIPFVCDLPESTSEPHPHEHIALAWASDDELDHFDLAPADVPIVVSWRRWLHCNAGSS